MYIELLLCLHSLIILSHFVNSTFPNLHSTRYCHLMLNDLLILQTIPRFVASTIVTVTHVPGLDRAASSSGTSNTSKTFRNSLDQKNNEMWITIFFTEWFFHGSIFFSIIKCPEIKRNVSNDFYFLEKAPTGTSQWERNLAKRLQFFKDRGNNWLSNANRWASQNFGWTGLWG